MVSLRSTNTQPTAPEPEALRWVSHVTMPGPDLGALRPHLFER